MMLKNRHLTARPMDAVKLVVMALVVAVSAAAGLPAWAAETENARMRPGTGLERARIQSEMFGPATARIQTQRVRQRPGLPQRLHLPTEGCFDWETAQRLLGADLFPSIAGEKGRPPAARLAALVAADYISTDRLAQLYRETGSWVRVLQRLYDADPEGVRAAVAAGLQRLTKEDCPALRPRPHPRSERRPLPEPEPEHTGSGSDLTRFIAGTLGGIAEARAIASQYRFALRDLFVLSVLTVVSEADPYRIAELKTAANTWFDVANNLDIDRQQLLAAIRRVMQ